jgi:hypothetical protein
MIEFLQNIAGGAFSGAVAAGFGYAKNRGQNFSKTEFSVSVLTGAVVGGAGSFLGVTYDNAETYLASIGALTLVQQGAKALLRRVTPWIKKTFNI